MSEDRRLMAWLDGDLSRLERDAFEASLREDRRLADEAHELRQTVRGLRDLPAAEAPGDFLASVQSRIRRRTRGRWYAIEAARIRFPYEAAFNILLIGLLMATYLSAVPAPDAEPVPVQTSVGALGAEPLDELLARFGPVEAVAGDARGVEVPVARLAELETALAQRSDAVIIHVGPGVRGGFQAVTVAPMLREGARP